jgi:hypothetical protein
MRGRCSCHGLSERQLQRLSPRGCGHYLLLVHGGAQAQSLPAIGQRLPRASGQQAASINLGDGQALVHVQSHQQVVLSLRPRPVPEGVPTWLIHGVDGPGCCGAHGEWCGLWRLNQSVKI